MSVEIYRSTPIVEILASTASAVGENNTASNVGAGAGIFKQKTGVNLEFKSLIAGSGVSLTPSADAITISTSASAWGGITGILSNQTDLQAALNAKQNSDSTLSALAAFNTNGYLVQTAPDTFVGRTIVANTSKVTITNGNGVSGNTTIDVNEANFAGIPQSAVTNLVSDLASKLSANQLITINGDANGSGTTTITLVIANDTISFAKMQNIASNRLLGRASAGSGDIQEITLGSGLVLTGSTLELAAAPAPVWGAITGTLSDQTDLQTALNEKISTALSSGNIIVGNGGGVATAVAMSGDASISNTGAVTVTGIHSSTIPTLATGFLKYDGSAFVFDNSAFLTANQTITLSGDATGSGSTAITVTLPTVNSNVGTFNNVTVNDKGQVTAASNVSYLTANQTITLSGDVTGSGTTSITSTIANDAVTFAKMQNINTARLLGRSTAGSGDIEEITLGANMTLVGGVLDSIGGGGGSGDMVLANAQTVTGAKTFNNGTLLMRNAANTFSSQFTNANTAARTYTLPDFSGTLFGQGANVLTAPASFSGNKVTFTPNATLAGLNVGSFGTSPSSLALGDIWFNDAAGNYQGRVLTGTRLFTVSTGIADTRVPYGLGTINELTSSASFTYNGTTLLVGGTTPTASTTLDIRGPGTSASTFGLRVANSANVTRLTLDDEGTLNLFTTATAHTWTGTTYQGWSSLIGSGGGANIQVGQIISIAGGTNPFRFDVSSIPTGGAAMEIRETSSDTNIGGANSGAFILTKGGFTRNSGTNTHTHLQLNPRYNTTGTYSGTAIGIDYNPTLTFTTGLTHLAWRNTSGSVLIGGTTLTNANTIVDIQSVTQGFALPRMTDTQRNAITSPYNGLQIHSTTSNRPNWHNGTAWQEAASRSDLSSWLTGTLTGNAIVTSNYNGATRRFDLRATSVANPTIFSRVLVNEGISNAGAILIEGVNPVADQRMYFNINAVGQGEFGITDNSTGTTTGWNASLSRTGGLQWQAMNGTSLPNYAFDYSANYTDRTWVDRGYVLGAKTYTERQTFATGNNGSLVVGTNTVDDSSPVNGLIMYNTTSNTFRFRQNGAWVGLGGGGGISNSAANNEIPKSDGANLVGTSFSSSVAGEFISSTFIDLIAAAGQNAFLRVLDGAGVGGSVIIEAGDGATNFNGGDISLQVGATGGGTGLAGNLALINTAGNFQSMQRGMFIGNSLAAPTGNPSGGSFFWIDSSSNNLIQRKPDGSVVDITASASASRPIVTTVSSNTTISITGSEQIVRGDTTSSNVTTTLPTASGITGHIIILKRISAGTNTWTIDANSTETIDGDLTAVLTTQYESITIFSNGTNWEII